MSEISAITFKVSHLDVYKNASYNAFQNVLADPSHENRLTFVIMLMAYWEASMNSWITDYVQHHEKGQFKNLIIERLTWLKAEEKVTKLPGLLSEGKLKIDLNNPIAKSVVALINIRHSLSHYKESYQTVSAEQDVPGADPIFQVDTDHAHLDKMDGASAASYANDVLQYISLTYSSFLQDWKSTPNTLLIEKAVSTVR
jgi:hypothetical protein